MTAARSGGLGDGVGALPAGPFSGARVSVWRTRTGTAAHGARSCPSLSRSTPVEHPHELGTGATLGELDWPSGLHCRLAFADPELDRYYGEAVAVGALREQARVALDAVAAARGKDWEPGVWDWPTMAGALAGAVHAPPAVPDDPALAALTRQTIEELTQAAEDIRAEVQPAHAYRLPPNGRAGLTALHRLCATQWAYGEYDGRDPGPRFVGYREAAWSAAEAALLAADPDARDRQGPHTSITMRGVYSTTPVDEAAHRAELEAALDADAYGPLQEAFFRGGQESFTHHRLYDLAHPPYREWADTLRSWSRGATFNAIGGDPYLRATFRRPGLLERVRPPLAAAEAAGTAYLGGLAEGAQRPMLIVLEVSHHVWNEYSWLPAALLLSAPSATIPPAKKPKADARPDVISRMVLVVPEVAANAIHTYERIAVPVAEEPTAAELQKVAAALRDVPDRADERVYRHYLEAAVRALPTGGRR
ncbi:MAG: hypothetical protein JWQ26_3169 [Modestobacter sp.]|nr:hypothetical protein [Modestobacter sp.]